MKKIITATISVIVVIVIIFLCYWSFLRNNCNRFSGDFYWSGEGVNLVSKCENASCKTNINNCSGSQDEPDSVACHLECTSE